MASPDHAFVDDVAGHNLLKLHFNSLYIVVELVELLTDESQLSYRALLSSLALKCNLKAPAS